MMNKKNFLTAFIFVSLLVLINADFVPDDRCIDGRIRICTTSEGCSGIQRCVSSKWGACEDISGDGCPAEALSAEILNPSDGNQFYIGTEIEFMSHLTCTNTPCIIKWDSNKDTGWYSSDENHTYSGLSIGDHNITLKITDSTEQIKQDSVVITIKPITTDVLSVSNFQITKIEPSNRYSVNGKIRVQAKINYYLNQAIQAKAFIIISDPRTGQAVYGPSPFYLEFSAPGYEEYDLNINLANYDFEERQNYKIEFLTVSNYVESSPEYFVDPMDPDSAYWDDGEAYYIPINQIPEQNKANNSGYEIIELGPAVIGNLTEMPEINLTAVIAVLLTALIILLKK